MDRKSYLAHGALNSSLSLGNIGAGLGLSVGGVGVGSGATTNNVHSATTSNPSTMYYDQIKYSMWDYIYRRRRRSVWFDSRTVFHNDVCRLYKCSDELCAAHLDPWLFCICAIIKSVEWYTFSWMNELETIFYEIHIIENR